MSSRISVTVGGVATLLAFAVGCASNPEAPNGYVKPTIAVMKFENRAQFPLAWNIGGGLRDILVDRLVSAGRYHVIERPELDAVLDELQLEQSGLTRPHDRATPGQLKNVQYLIKGTVTDFTHTGSAHGFFGNGTLGIFGGGSQAVMGMTLYVVDVESGEILCSKSLQESVTAASLDVSGTYKNVAFGGGIFMQTPLGEATARVINRAVGQITESVATRPWQPRIAVVSADRTVLLNGGVERGLSVGTEYEVMELGEPILDPDNGDLLGRRPGRGVGQLRVSEVQQRYSVAMLVDGEIEALQVGHVCRRVER